jgi:pimeloyl-ACP methyl ester carboxylesterase
MTAQVTMLRPSRGTVVGIDCLRRGGKAGALSLVLLHGIGSNASTFVPLMAALPGDIDVVAWNAPGYAGSRPLDQAQPVPGDYAAALLRLLDAFAMDRIILCGHSLGALFAASFAARYPARVRALALVSPALGYRVAPGEKMPANVQARIDEVQTLDLETFAAKRAPRLVHAHESKPQIVAAVHDAMSAVNPHGYVQAAHALGVGDLLGDAAAIAAPASVAVGVEDVITPPANARKAYDALPHALKFHEIAGAGHALPQENPAATAAVLTELVEQIDV